MRLIPGLSLRNLARESLAGVTLLAIAVPLNIGYAQIAGLSPTAGLYALVVPTIVYALLASSRQVVASPDAAAAALVFSSLTGLGVAGEDFATMAAAQAVLCGLFLVAASVLKLGFLANFLSKPILVGFVGGLALEVLLSQVAKMLGLKLAPGEEFSVQLGDLVSRLGDAAPVSVLMSALAIAVLLACRRFAPGLPAALLVLIAATLSTGWLNLEATGVAVLGEVEGGAPQFALPKATWVQWLSLVPSALALALITMTEGVLVSRSYAAKRGYLVSPDRDLLAFGAANITAGASLSFSVGSSTSRTAAMDQLGSRTQLPSLVLALGAFILLLVGTDLLAQIPSPAIGAVVTVAVLRLLGIGELREIFTQSRYEFAIGLACLIGVLVLGPLGGLFLAFVLALVNLARRASRPEITVLAAAPDADGAPVELVQSEDLPGALSAARPTAIVIRFAAPVFFANGAVLTNRVADVVREAGPGLEAVIIDAEAITDIDVTGVHALREVEDTLGNAGITLAVSRLRPGLKDRLHRFGLLVDVPEFETNREALAALPRPSITSAARPSSGEEQA